MLVMISFLIISISFIFTSVLVKEAGSTYLIEPTADIGRDVLNNETSLPAAQGVDTITQLENDYNNFLFPYDLFFLAIWISVFVSTVFLAFKSNREGIFSFFGYLFIGTLLLLLLTTYMSDFASWFMAEIFDTVFASANVSLPIFTFYISNLGLIHFSWWIILVLLNVIDRNFISRTGEVEE